MDLINIQEVDQWIVKDDEPCIRHVSDLYSVLSEMYIDQTTGKELLSGIPIYTWPAFTAAYGGARAGDVVVVTGDTGQGKTTFVTNWLMEMVRQGTPGLLISLEMKWKAMMRKIAQMVQEKPFSQFEAIDMNGVHDVLKGLPLQVLYHRGLVAEERILKAISLASEKYGTKVVMLDHLDFVEKKSAKHWQNEAYVIQEFMGRIGAVAEAAKVCVILIVHPSKRNLKGVKNEEVGLDELKGSSAIKQNADAVLGVWQPDPSSFETRVRFLKMREDDYSKSYGGFIRFMFKSSSLRLEEGSAKLERDR